MQEFLLGDTRLENNQISPMELEEFVKGAAKSGTLVAYVKTALVNLT